MSKDCGTMPVEPVRIWCRLFGKAVLHGQKEWGGEASKREKSRELGKTGLEDKAVRCHGFGVTEQDSRRPG